MIRRLLITLTLAGTIGMAAGACNTNPASSPTLDPALSPAATMPVESPSMAPLDSPSPSAS